MRLYTFTNFYLSSIQQGIQPAHLIGDLFIKYRPGQLDAIRSDAQDVLYDWAANHKTMICLNGGNLGSIRMIANQLDTLGVELGLPTGRFFEDEESLGNIMTTTGIVVPAEIYERAAEMRGQPYEDVAITSDPELKLIDLLNGFGLAK